MSLRFLSAESAHRLDALATTAPFRTAFALAGLALHLAALVPSGAASNGTPKRAAPAHPRVCRTPHRMGAI